MAEKDSVTKTLEAYNDVFADIINVCLFNGEQRVKPEELDSAGTISQYKASGKILSQERDTQKSGIILL